MSAALALPFDPAAFDLTRFTDDVARRIWTPRIIADRYGLSAQEFVDLIRMPEIAKMIKLKSQQFHSDANAKERISSLWAIGMIEAASTNIAMLGDPNTPIAQKIELLKLGAKFVGFDRAETAGQTGPLAARFAVTIQFSSHKETIEGHVSAAAQVIEGVALPAPEETDA